MTLSSDAAAHVPPGVPLVFFHGEDDETVPIAHLDMYLDVFPAATAHRLPGRDHQLNNDLSEVARAIKG